MSLLLQIGIVLYELGIMPFALGVMWMRLWKKKVTPFAYVVGYFLMFTVFLALAVPMVCVGASLTEIVLVWKVFSAGVMVVFLTVVLVYWQEICGMFAERWGRMQRWEPERGLFLLFCCVAVLLSIACVTPSIEDDTVEIAAIMADTGTIYQYQPYTLEEYPTFPNEKVFSPIELFYVVNAALVEMDVVIFIHVLLPLFLTPVFFAAFWHVGNYFWCDDYEKKELFVTFAIIFYSVGAYTVKALAMGALQNIWNGTSFACACIFPVVLIESFSLMDNIGQGKQREIVEHIMVLLLCVTAGQLVLPDSWLITAMIVACSAVVKFTKRYLIHDRNH